MPEKEAEISAAADLARKILAHAEEAATEKIAGATRDAEKLLAGAAQSALKVWTATHDADHTLLIKLEERLEGLKTLLNGIKDGLSKQVDKHETRIDVLEKAQNVAEGRTGLSTPIMMMVGGLVGGLIMFIIQQILTK